MKSTRSVTDEPVFKLPTPEAEVGAGDRRAHRLRIGCAGFTTVPSDIDEGPADKPLQDRQS
jgi:hypothetical protein